MVNSIYCLIPPLVIIVMVMLTRKVVLSLSVGIVLASFILESFNVVDMMKRIGMTAVHIVYIDGEINKGNLYILLFMTLLGILTSFIYALGGNAAFGKWTTKRICSKRGAQVATAGIGMTLFPDDVFNMFSTGQIARPMIDKHGVSRSKLAYLVHSTSDPLCVLCPISSWGAYITAILATIFATNGLDYNPIVAYMGIASMNFYAITTIILVFTVAWFNLNIGKMRQIEERTHQQKKDSEKDEGVKGSVYDLIVPTSCLVIGTLVSILYTGYMNSEQVTFLSIFENSQISISLVFGSFFALCVALGMYVRNVYRRGTMSTSQFIPTVISGFNSMKPALVILLFAWMLSELTGELQTGQYLAGVVEDIQLSPSFLPIIIFLLTGIMAFSTGTSWGTFAIMLPIAAQIAITTSPEMLFLMLAAVLSGSLFGDHCSPISDTTTVASVAAGCAHMDHVLTQLPYALIAATITACNFLLYGLTNKLWISYLFMPLAIGVIVVMYTRREKVRETEYKIAS